MSFVERCRQRHLGCEGGDEGFTLIELLVVLLIIGILLAIAIPTYLSITKGANNEAAQSNLQTALTGAKTYYTQSNQSYNGIMGGVSNPGTSTITQVDTGVSYISGATSGNHVVSILATNGGAAVVLVAFSPGTNRCWGILDNTATDSTGLLDNISKGIGTWFFWYGGTTATTTCQATSSLTPIKSSLNGFPN